MRMLIDSLSCLVLRWLSVSKIVAPDQSVTWFSFATWSVIADSLVFAAKSYRSARVNGLLLMDSTSFLCSSWFIRYYDLRQRKSAENKTTQGVNLHTHGGQLYEQRRGSLQPTNDLWPHFGHALIIIVRWLYAWWNVAIRYRFLRMVVLYEYIIVANPTWWTFTNKIKKYKKFTIFYSISLSRICAMSINAEIENFVNGLHKNNTQHEMTYDMPN